MRGMMRQPFRDVVLDQLIEQLEHLQVRLSLVENPDLDTNASAQQLREDIVEIEARIAAYRKNYMPNEEAPEQGALFEIEVDDDDGCVWIVGKGGHVYNLGPEAAVSEKLADWLGERDYGE